MATNVIYGASVYQERKSETDIFYDAFGKNSEVFTAGDPVTISSGVLLVTVGNGQGVTNAVVGVASKTATMTSTNQTVAKVSPGYIPADGTIFLMGTNSDLTGNATDPGTYYGLTGLTSLIQVNTSIGVLTGTSRVVEVVQVDPFNEGGTGAGSGLRKVLVRFVKTPYTNVNIST